jgi:hypothetical protein
LDPKQADLLKRICDNLLLNVDDLRSVGALTAGERLS